MGPHSQKHEQCSSHFATKKLSIKNTLHGLVKNLANEMSIDEFYEKRNKKHNHKSMFDKKAKDDAATITLL